MEFKCACINGISYGNKNSLVPFRKIPNVDFGDHGFFGTLYDSDDPE